VKADFCGTRFLASFVTDDLADCRTTQCSGSTSARQQRTAHCASARAEDWIMPLPRHTAACSKAYQKHCSQRTRGNPFTCFHIELLFGVVTQLICGAHPATAIPTAALYVYVLVPGSNAAQRLLEPPCITHEKEIHMKMK